MAHIICALRLALVYLLVLWKLLHLYLYLHHHFAAGVCIPLLFLEPSWCSLQAGVCQFWQPSRHLLRSCAFNLCKPLAIMSHSSSFFHLFFCLLFLTSFAPTPTVLGKDFVYLKTNRNLLWFLIEIHCVGSYRKDFDLQVELSSVLPG